jgi:hypothetical protein
VSSRHVTSARLLTGIALASAAAVGCGGHSTSAGSLRLINDTRSAVTVTDCTGGGAFGCTAIAHHQLSPKQAATFPLSSANLGSSPDSLAIHGDGRTRCFVIPPKSDRSFLVNVTDTSAMQCADQDRTAPGS